MSLRLNVGAGFDKKEGYVNIDSSVEVNPDVICDLDEERLPYEDSSVDVVYSRHSLEHFSKPVEVLEELYRVSKNGSIWNIIVPFGFSHQDTLFHKTIGWHHGSFDKMLVDNPRPYYTCVRLRLLKAEGHADGWLKLLPFKRKLSSLFNNIYREIEFVLEVVK